MGVNVFLIEPSRVPQSAWLELLNDSERERHRRFRQQADRDSYLATHGLLRLALSQVRPAIDPREWKFTIGAHGKPELAGADSIHFNVSHCRELVAVAIGDRPLGVDVEPVDARHSTDDVARRVYGPQELVDLQRAVDRVDRFFTRWVLKEAWVKATGVGIHDSLPSFELEIGAKTAHVISGEPAQWKFSWWTPMPGVKLAVCVDSERALEVTPFFWEPS